MRSARNIPLSVLSLLVFAVCTLSQQLPANGVDYRLESKLMGRAMPYRVTFPLRYLANDAQRFPVVYLLHGLTGNYSNWYDKTALKNYVHKYGAIIVTPEGENGWYTDSAAKPTDKFESYIIKELIPEIDKKFRTIADRDHRAIAGLSMGGYGAIKFGVKYPEMFVVAGSFSGALGAASITEKQIPGALGRSIDAIFGATGSETRAGNDLFLLLRGSTPEKIKALPFLYIDCGTEDFLFKNNQDFVALLLEKKVPHEYRQLPGGHNWKYWDAQVEEFLEIASHRFEESTATYHPATSLSTDVKLSSNLRKLDSESVARLDPVAPPVQRQQKTEVNDAQSARLLLGRHKLSLQWVSWEHFGVATVTNRGGSYSIKGEQKGRGNEVSSFVKLDGRVTSIEAKEFTFAGKIVTQVSHINGGKPCERDGEFTFKITGKRRYWRLQQMDNPCDPVTDYVDVYFR